MSGDAMIV